MKILIVDDEELIRDIIKNYCENEGFSTIEAVDGNDALNKFKSNDDIDIVILDIMMPNKDGFTAYQEMKNLKNIPTIILSARSEEYDKLNGFDMGVDDYVTKPFSPKELIARIKAILKRSNTYIDCYTYKTLKVDYKAHSLLIDNKEIEITPKEYELLIYFIKNKTHALSREQIINEIWGYDFYGDDRTIDTHIKTLRKRLGIYRNLIRTVRGVGYKYEEK